MSNALALSQWLPDVVTSAPNPGDVVQVLAVPVGQVPTTQFAPKGGGGGGGGGAPFPSASASGHVLVSGAGPTFSPVWGDVDAGRF